MKLPEQAPAPVAPVPQMQLLVEVFPDEADSTVDPYKVAPVPQMLLQEVAQFVDKATLQERIAELAKERKV